MAKKIGKFLRSWITGVLTKMPAGFSTMGIIDDIYEGCSKQCLNGLHRNNK